MEQVGEIGQREPMKIQDATDFTYLYLSPFPGTMLPSLKNNRWSGLMMKASVADAGHANFELKKVYNEITSVPKFSTAFSLVIFIARISASTIFWLPPKLC